jgi:hypothetical protein
MRRIDQHPPDLHASMNGIDALELDVASDDAIFKHLVEASIPFCAVAHVGFHLRTRKRPGET